MNHSEATSRSDAALRTPLCDLIGCRYPILQAGMGGVARSELVEAVSAAGGFGCLGMVREPPELIAREIASVRSRTDRPFGVNLIPAATDPTLFDEELAVCLEAKVRAMVFFWDVVPEAIETAKRAGCRVLYQVGSLAAARAAEAAGADAVIVQGVEAGGHVHGSVSSLILLPQVASALKIPVVGSGGFSSGASLVAALALGAQGIHCGTAFLATRESFAHDLHKRRVLAASCEETVHTDAFAINWPPHSPVRVIASDVTETLGDRLFGYKAEDLPREAIAMEDDRPIYLFSTDSPLQSMRGDLERLALFAGQVAGRIEAIEPAGEIVATIARDALAILSDLARRGAATG
ncbi:NAD(P)H-dependent flavin oxidoreductase [Aurantimonas sp. A3-2-R12]|uniref:NAD(P)H-dependent flavin oxidoreductase n=1 Tax=Aurantimonas sp. A3-2-R12 TaxID=3114362 RepID=UPI002E19BBA6|nr:nitronate monooxygenase [Aurantimonas sp. A3-2-R12]